MFTKIQYISNIYRNVLKNFKNIYGIDLDIVITSRRNEINSSNKKEKKRNAIN